MVMPLWSFLAVVTGAGLLLGTSEAALTAAALLANWCICTLYAWSDGSQFAPMPMAAIDLGTAAAILFMPYSRYQVLLAASYLYGLGWHAFVEAIGVTPWTAYHYWYALHYMAWAQAWLALVWTVHGGVQAIGSGRNPWWRVYLGRDVPDAVARRAIGERR